MTGNYLTFGLVRDDYAPYAAAAVRGCVIDGNTKLTLDVCEAATITELVTHLVSRNEVSAVKLPDDSLDSGDYLSLAEVAEAVYYPLEKQVERREVHPSYTSADHYLGLGV